MHIDTEEQSVLSFDSFFWQPGEGSVLGFVIYNIKRWLGFGPLSSLSFIEQIKLMQKPMQYKIECKAQHKR